MLITSMAAPVVAPSDPFKDPLYIKGLPRHLSSFELGVFQVRQAAAFVFEKIEKMNYFFLPHEQAFLLIVSVGYLTPSSIVARLVSGASAILPALVLKVAACALAVLLIAEGLAAVTFVAGVFVWMALSLPVGLLDLYFRYAHASPAILDAGTLSTLIDSYTRQNTLTDLDRANALRALQLLSKLYELEVQDQSPAQIPKETVELCYQLAYKYAEIGDLRTALGLIPLNSLAEDREPLLRFILQKCHGVEEDDVKLIREAVEFFLNPACDWDNQINPTRNNTQPINYEAIGLGVEDRIGRPEGHALRRQIERESSWTLRTYLIYKPRVWCGVSFVKDAISV